MARRGVASRPPNPEPHERRLLHSRAKTETIERHGTRGDRRAGPAGPVDRDDRGGRDRPPGRVAGHADLDRSARFDVLTGLPSRAELESTLSDRARARGQGERSGALIADRAEPLRGDQRHLRPRGRRRPARRRGRPARPGARRRRAALPPERSAVRGHQPGRGRVQRRPGAGRGAAGRAARAVPHRHRPPAGGDDGRRSP